MFSLLNKNLRETPRCRPGEDWAPDGDYHLSGLVAGTRIATETGWRPVETVSVGERVLTFDNGAREVVATTRGAHFAVSDTLPEFATPIDVPTGAIGNEDPMVLLPEQPVLVESDAAEAMTGDPFALVPAKALVGYRGIERFRSLRPIDVITLHLENDELLFADGGGLLLSSSCVAGVASLDALDTCGAASPYMTLTGRDAVALTAAMAREDALRFGTASPAVA